MYLLIKFFGLAFSALLPLVNPLGSALVLLSMVGPAPLSVYKNLARKIATATILFLVAVELMGTALFSFFGISLPVMQVSGGLVIAVMGWGLLTQVTLPGGGTVAVYEPRHARPKSMEIQTRRRRLARRPARTRARGRAARRRTRR